MWLAFSRQAPSVAFFCIDWVGYCENLATLLFADLHWRICFFMQNKNIDNNNTKTFFDALAMKATASFIHERITWDDWNMFLHYQVQFKHTIWQRILPGMSFQAWGGTKLRQGDVLFSWRVMLAHYHWNLVIYLCYIIRIIVVLTISSALPYPPTCSLPHSLESRAKASNLRSRWPAFLQQTPPPNSFCFL